MWMDRFLLQCLLACVFPRLHLDVKKKAKSSIAWQFICFAMVMMGAAALSEAPEASHTGSQHRVHLVGLHGDRQALVHIGVSSVTITEPTGEVRPSTPITSLHIHRSAQVIGTFPLAALRSCKTGTKPILHDVVASELRDHYLLLEMATDAGPKALQLRAQDAATAQLLTRKLEFLREHHSPAIADTTGQPLLQPSPASPRPHPASPPPIRTAPPPPPALRGSQLSPTAAMLASPLGPSPPRGVNPNTLEAELDSPLAPRAAQLIAQAARRLKAAARAEVDTAVRRSVFNMLLFFLIWAIPHHHTGPAAASGLSRGCSTAPES